MLNDPERLDIYKEEIRCVKSQVMEYLEDVHEARYFVAEASKNSEIGELLDPEGNRILMSVNMKVL